MFSINYVFELKNPVTTALRDFIIIIKRNKLSQRFFYSFNSFS